MLTKSCKLANGDTIKVEYGLQDGNKSPYFSITGAIYEGRRRDPSVCGCIHEDIEAAFPGEFSDLIALHLSDRDGVPMHALANGLYFLPDAEKLQAHLRITGEEYTAMLLSLPTGTNEGRRIGFAAYVDSLRPRWKAEADAAIAKHKIA